jgi:hypothetical protein
VVRGRPTLFGAGMNGATNARFATEQVHGPIGQYSV